MQTDIFDFEFSVGSALDIGVLRDSNQDRVIACPETGFFAVSDGMGGLAQGGKTSEIIAETLPEIVEEIWSELRGKEVKDLPGTGKDTVGELRGKGADPALYGKALRERVRLVSDNIYDIVNTVGIGFGATLTCVWLIGKAAVFVNLGDSRAYILPRYRQTINQITEDHNVANELVLLGELTREEAQGHPSSSQLTQFMGMPAPAQPDVFIETVEPGDRILICSDGVNGMLADSEIRQVMRSSRWPNAVGRRLVRAANQAGGRDNISAVYIRIGPEKQ